MRDVEPPLLNATAGHTLTLASGRLLGYSEYGDPSGVPVFTFHGWPGSRMQGLRYHAAAQRVGVRLIAPDRPGFGLSDFVAGRTIADWPADTAALADRLGISRFGVLGVSGGSAYALACARFIPERVSRVAIFSGFGPLDIPEVRQTRAWFGPLVRSLGSSSPLVLRILLALVAAGVNYHVDSLLRFGASRLPAPDRAIVTQLWYRSIAAADLRTAFRDGGKAAAADARLLTGPWRFDVQEIRTPIYLWHGLLDTIADPAAARYLARVLPSCYPTFLPDGGHYAVVPHAEEVLTTLIT